MAVIALYGFDEKQERDLKWLLEARGHQVVTGQTPGQKYADPHFSEADIEVAVVSFTAASPLPTVGAIGSKDLINSDNPVVLIVCSKFLSPQFELDLEERGFRVLYA
jgi:hypothetical protein